MIDVHEAGAVKDKIFAKDELRYNVSKKELGALECGDIVLLQNPKTKLWSEKGMVSSIRPDKQSYTIKIDDHELIRHRSMLKKCHVTPSSDKQSQSAAVAHPVSKHSANSISSPISFPKSALCADRVKRRQSFEQRIANIATTLDTNLRITMKTRTSINQAPGSPSSPSNGQVLPQAWGSSSSLPQLSGPSLLVQETVYQGPGDSTP
jgi:hypothetical protein